MTTPKPPAGSPPGPLSAHLPACPLCGAARGRTIHRESWITIRRCAACRFLFSEERRGDFRDDELADEIAGFYDWLDRYRDERVPLLDNQLRRIAARFGLGGAPLSVLEVGTGGGALARACSIAGHRYVGLEPLLGERFTGSEDPRVTILPVRLEDYRTEERFDVAVMDNVLEHLADPVAAARHVLGLLRPGGVLWVQVPNEGNPRWRHRLISLLKERRITFPGHVNLFTARTLRACLRRAGAGSVRIGYTSASHPVLTRLLLMGEPGPLLRAAMAVLRRTRLDVLTGWGYWVDGYARPGPPGRVAG